MIRITGGKFKGRMIREVPDRRTRYTSSVVRQAIFNMIDVYGKSFLDLFCGSCLVLIEAISRGAAGGAGVDISRRAISTCKDSLKSLGILNLVKLYKADATRFVKSEGESFDIIFMDPPYGLGLSDKVLKRMKKDILKDGGIVIVEEEKRWKVTAPEFLEVVSEKIYGDTKLVVMRKT